MKFDKLPQPCISMITKDLAGTIAEIGLPDLEIGFNIFKDCTVLVIKIPKEEWGEYNLPEDTVDPALIYHFHSEEVQKAFKLLSKMESHSQKKTEVSEILHRHAAQEEITQRLEGLMSRRSGGGLGEMLSMLATLGRGPRSARSPIPGMKIMSLEDLLGGRIPE